MLRPARVTLMALTAVLTGPPGARADLETQLTAFLESDSAWRVRSPRQLQKSETLFGLDLDLQLSSAFDLHVDGRAIYDPVGLLVGPDPDPDYRPIDRAQLGGSRHAEAELREAYVDWNGRFDEARLDVRLGKQQVVWGQAFGLRVLDIVNPQDFREYLLDDFVDARIPTFAFRADAMVRGISVQALVVPDFEADRYPDREAEFAFDPAVPGVFPVLEPLPPAVGSGALVSFAEPDEPKDWRPRSLGYGLRVGAMRSGLDLALHYWDRPDPMPVHPRRVISITLPGVGDVPLNVIEPEHPRVRTVGGSFATAGSDFALWGEGGLSLGRFFALEDPNDADGLVRRNEIQYALGLDWTGAPDLFANLQWIQFVILDHDRSIQVDRSRSFATLLLRQELWAATLIPQLFVVYGLNEGDSMVRPSLEWRVTDRLSLTTGLDIFTGPREGFFGQFARERSCAPIPASLPLPGAGTCGYEPPPGRASRAFIQIRYAFELDL